MKTKHIIGKTYALSKSDSKQYIFYHNLKCATRSIIGYLNDHNIVDGTEDQTDYQVEYNDDWNNYFQFSFIRNPYDRLLSCFLDKTKKVIGTQYEIPCYSKYADTNFKDFVMGLTKYPWQFHDRHLAPQVELINFKHLNFIGRFENLNNDFSYVRKILDLNDNDLPHRNTTDHKQYRQYYDMEMIEKVRYIYNSDFEIFEYDF